MRPLHLNSLATHVASSQSYSSSSHPFFVFSRNAVNSITNVELTADGFAKNRINIELACDVTESANEPQKSFSLFKKKREKNPNKYKKIIYKKENKMKKKMKNLM